ncbi:MAG: acyl-CoA dehydrogenase [Firmicutes bacterium]|nr:acyl-CoA dehydrogenase [Bacillota bacterium]
MIDFSLTPEQEALQKMAREFAEKEIAPVAAQYDRSGEYPREIVRKAFQAGLVYGSIPEKYGGGGIGAVDQLLIVEELSAACAGISSCIAINSLAAIPLVNFGSEAQKDKYLGTACREEKLMAFCVTEPGAGSDVAAMTTMARRLNGEYVISGRKTFITNGGVADYYIVFATVDRSRGHRGITAFIVPREAEGLSVGEKEDKMGQRAADTRDVIFDEVVVPAADRIGKEGEGFKIIMQTFNHSRPGVAASAVGVARSAMEHALQYALEREQFGMPIFMHQAVMFMLADMARDIAAGRLLAWQAAWKGERGLDNSKEAAMAKVFCGDMVMRVTTDAAQIFGGYGYVKDYPVEKLMRDAKVFQIYEGTSQIQRLLIGRALAKEKLK